jgi:hypothetical protein
MREREVEIVKQGKQVYSHIRGREWEVWKKMRGNK